MQNNTKKYFLEQWERVKRWYEKVKESRDSNVSSVEYQDILYAFFLNCYHLKDWISNTYPDCKEEVELFFDKENGDEYGKICADIVNGVKHYKLDSPRVIGEYPVDKTGNDVLIECSLSGAVKTYDNPFVRNDKGEKYNLNKIADKCFKFWGGYFNPNKEKTREVIIKGLEKLIEEDRFLIDRDVDERSITAKLSCYLQDLFKCYGYDVDHEYNREFSDPKRDSKGNLRRPDIIIHRRDNNNNNLVVIEVKKKQHDTDEDERKLINMKKDQNYKYAFLIKIDLNKNISEWLKEV